ncbi:type II toxin-antitoxin system ParD family antitoxin [Rhizobium tubonense]|uniref:Type II toxin-antitoxin system ParD family antitoxin n=1 Tax=Rhizobium tubonense TaxID=484088 RepID=A0A2W4EBT7_9HYPH|nr:type II toxin-antitoxin system ParD family antitoxin [Rhizobium tubonense]PZM09603.1 type II toxin-antitoxin system ParD family antitoxin [Rhizobium tubonense]
MAKVISVTIDEQMDKFIDEQVSHGKFRSPVEAIDAALRLLRHQIEDHGALAGGEGSVKPQPFNFDEFLKDHYRRHSL